MLLDGSCERTELRLNFRHCRRTTATVMILIINTDYIRHCCSLVKFPRYLATSFSLFLSISPSPSLSLPLSSAAVCWCMATSFRLDRSVLLSTSSQPLVINVRQHACDASMRSAAGAASCWSCASVTTQRVNSRQTFRQRFVGLRTKVLSGCTPPRSRMRLCQSPAQAGDGEVSAVQDEIMSSCLECLGYWRFDGSQVYLASHWPQATRDEPRPAEAVPAAVQYVLFMYGAGACCRHGYAHTLRH